MTEKIKIIVSIVSPTIPLLTTLIVFLQKFIKSEKAKKVAERMNKILSFIEPAVKEAENLLHYNGKEKKEYVTTKVNQKCLEENIKFDGEMVSTLIEKIVKLTKEVNSREKDKLKKLD